MAREFGKIFYGLHMYPGVAEYRPKDKEPYRVFVSEDAIRRMGPSFAGKPLFVRHVNEVDLKNLEHTQDGIVVESFFNKADGKHWTKFAVFTDAGHAAIRAGFKLSNAYYPTSEAPGGIHNGLDYDKEVVEGEYEHLALVDDPRYEESKILTPEEFKKYNETKELELTRLANSKENEGDKQMGFSIFKKTKVENSADLEGSLVHLPLSKKEMTIANALTEYDKILNMQGYANADHMVKIGDEEMSVNDLSKKYSEMKAEKDKALESNDQDEQKEPKLGNDEDDTDTMENDSKDGDQDEEKEPKLGNKKSNSSDKEKATKKPAKKEGGENFKKLMNAEDDARDEDETVDLAVNQVQRGKARYGA